MQGEKNQNVVELYLPMVSFYRVMIGQIKHVFFLKVKRNIFYFRCTSRWALLPVMYNGVARRIYVQGKENLKNVKFSTVDSQHSLVQRHSTNAAKPFTPVNQ